MSRFDQNNVSGLGGLQGVTWILALTLALGVPRNMIIELFLLL